MSTEMPHDLRLLSLSKAAATLGTSPYLVKKLIASGDLHAVKVNDRLRISVGELRRYVSGGGDAA